ncbi:MAG: hypothetical protein ACREU6_01565 [Steroidobacteraceae bacterium]
MRRYLHALFIFCIGASAAALTEAARADGSYTTWSVYNGGPDSIHYSKLAQFPAPDEDAVTGYPEELRDFIGAVTHQRQPKSDLMLAADVLTVVYAGYCSAQSGERIHLTGYL